MRHALVLVLLVGCRNSADTVVAPQGSPLASASAVAKSTATSATPAAPPATSATPAALGPIETLLVRPIELWRITQSADEIIWLEPQPEKQVAHTASMLAFSKRAPSKERLLASAAIPFYAVSNASTFAIANTRTAYLLAPEPDGRMPSTAYRVAQAVDLTAGTIAKLPLPKDVPTFDHNPIAATTRDLLAVASRYSDPKAGPYEGYKTELTVFAKIPRAKRMGWEATALAGAEGTLYAIARMDNRSHIVAINAETFATSTLASTPDTRVIDSVAASPEAVAWTQPDVDGGMRRSSLWVKRTDKPPVKVAESEWPHELQIAAGRLCWATFELRAGVPEGKGSYGTKQADTMVLCVPLDGGATTRIVGPLPQLALGFAIDETHVYWAEVATGSTKFQRRAIEVK
jgi:hypothetical protein